MPKIKENDFYEIHFDKSIGLEYVRLKKRGVDELKTIYQERGKIKRRIEVFESGGEFGDKFIDFLQKQFTQMNPGEVKGAISLELNDRDGGFVHEGNPYILVRDKEGRNIIFLFSSSHVIGSGDYDHRFINIIHNINLRQMSSYGEIPYLMSEMQRDSDSCTICSFFLLKNLLDDDVFIGEVLQSLSFFQHQEMNVSQASGYVKRASVDNIQKYFRNPPRSSEELFNFRVFFKGHHYAHLIAERNGFDHNKFISKTTIGFVDNITKARSEIKLKQKVLQAVDGVDGELDTESQGGSISVPGSSPVRSEASELDLSIPVGKSH